MVSRFADERKVRSQEVIPNYALARISVGLRRFCSKATSLSHRIYLATKILTMFQIPRKAVVDLQTYDRDVGLALNFSQSIRSLCTCVCVCVVKMLAFDN